MQTPPPIPPQPNITGLAVARVPLPPRPEVVQDNHPCLKCGYNLRGLSIGGVCPECGTTIGESLRTYLLAYAPSEYVKSVHTGLLFIIIGAAGFALSTILPTFMFMVPRAMGMNPLGMLPMQSWLAVIAYIPTLIAVVGYWLCTPRDPGLSNFANVQTPRLLTRISVITVVICGIFMLIAQFVVAKAMVAILTPLLGPGGTGTAGTPPSVVTIINTILSIPFGWIATSMIAGTLHTFAWLSLYFSLMYYLRLLAPRLPDQQLKELAEMWLWLLPVIYVGGSCFMIGPFAAICMYIYFLWRFRARLGTLAVVTQRG